MTNKQKISELLITLTVSELEEIKNKISFLLPVKSVKVSDTSEMLLYTVITTKLTKETGEQYRPFNIFIKTTQMKKKIKEVVAYLNKSFVKFCVDKKQKRTYKIKYYNIFAELMIRDITDSPLPLTVNCVLNNYEKFAALLEQNFPGYGASGLVSWVIFGKKGN